MIDIVTMICDDDVTEKVEEGEDVVIGVMDLLLSVTNDSRRSQVIAQTARLPHGVNETKDQRVLKESLKNLCGESLKT